MQTTILKWKKQEWEITTGEIFPKAFKATFYH